MTAAPYTICRHPGAGDAHTTRQPLCSRAAFWHDVASPARVLEVLQRCRVVVVGSYHAAVFALSMGIPAVMIAAREHYAQKLHGLAHQFGVGCQVELASHPELAMRLQAAIESAWTCAPGTRVTLLAAARNQVVASEAAYERLFELMEARAPRCRQGHTRRAP